ncbi:type 1 glutamine amidotransferase domain-containing protein [Massilia sp. PAMC28688]|uniref:type 1 glutamine amidotransferase domain-containing protein n=1 Tax=Massilia sp. PAMC28688 TaxID=2861283 RepID=UPI001C62B3B1|nr:type 1 glutamine amidotransferase domain-containing protein [Massilia sp. PAMC28688]QYF95119.1 type 1 glutamine amidotransferase domain-containing protein [Massilia sp. PAMC28688]
MKRTILRGAAWLAAVLALLIGATYLYYLSLGIDKIARPNVHATPADIAYLRQAVPDQRGRILAVVSSAARMPDGKKKAGYELTELSRAYYVFKVNGYDVDIASPAGGRPPEVLDDMTDLDYAFLNDPAAQARVKQSLRLADVDAARYDAIYFVGGKGAMFDFPGNPDVARLVKAIGKRGVVGAICHGPAALLKLTGEDGKPFVAGKRVTMVTNEEELFLRDDARQVFPFLLEDQALAEGARLSRGLLFLDHAVTDGRLVTGQNPWASWSTAEGMIRALGHQPVARRATDEERSVKLLATYYRDGFEPARRQQAEGQGFDKMLLLMHALVAGMQWRLDDAFQIQRLANP